MGRWGISSYEGWPNFKKFNFEKHHSYSHYQNKDMTCFNKFEILKQDVTLHSKV